MTFRKPKSEKEYQEYLKKRNPKECIYCNKDLLVAEFKYWQLQKNRFPYDRFAKEHLMLAPKRHIADKKDLTERERIEMELILDKLHYDLCLENKPHKRSVLPHYHIHLIILK